MTSWRSDETCEHCDVLDSEHSRVEVDRDCLGIQLLEERDANRRLKQLLYQLDPEWQLLDLEADP